jgi:hypothetical protein
MDVYGIPVPVSEKEGNQDGLSRLLPTSMQDFNVGRFAVPTLPNDVLHPYETEEERRVAPTGALVRTYGFRFRLTEVREASWGSGGWKHILF